MCKWQLEKAAEHGSQYAQGAGVFEAVGRLVELLERKFDVFQGAVVVDQLAHRALAVVDLLENLVQVRHRTGGGAVEGVVLDQLAQGALPGVDLADHVVGVADRVVGVVQKNAGLVLQGPDVGGGALQIAHHTERCHIQLVRVHQQAQRPLALGDPAGDRLDVVDPVGEIGLVVLHELRPRPQQLVNLFAAEALGQVLHAGGHAVNLDHQVAQIGLLDGFQSRAVLGFDAGRGAETNVEVVLAHEPGESDGRFAVGFHFGLAVQIDRHLRERVGAEPDVLDPSDLDTAHFDRVADLELLDVFESGVQVVAALEEGEGVEGFHDDKGGDDREGEEHAEPGFDEVFHKLDGLRVQGWKFRVKKVLNEGIGIVPQFPGRADEENPALHDHRHPVGDAERQAPVMGDDDGGGLRSAFELEDFLADGHGHQRVQLARRLVKQDQLRVPHQSAGDGDPFLHAAGKLIGHAVLDAFQAHGVQFGGDHAGDFIRRRQAVFAEVKPHIFRDRQGRQQGRGLKHHRHAEFLPDVRGVNGLALDENLAAVRLEQADDVLEQDAFAAAARPHDDEYAAGGDFERDALEHLPAVEAPPQVADFDERVLGAGAAGRLMAGNQAKDRVTK